MTWGNVIALAPAVIGGIMGGSDKGSSGGGGGGGENQTARSVTSGGSSSQSYIDPRMEQMLYGAGGVIPNATNWYQQNQSGLNDKMITGMNNQWNQLGASAQGFNQMQNMGMGLMGGGVAGNPFTGNGGMAAQNTQNMQNTPYKPAVMETTGSGQNQFQMPTPYSAPAMAAQPQGGGGGGLMEPEAEPVAPAQNNGLLSYWELANQQGWSPGDTGA